MTVYPGIERATLEMSACNGGINRDRSAATVKARLGRFLSAGADLAFDLRSIDAWLAALSDDDLATAVDGEETAHLALCEKGPPGAAQFLTAIFESAI
jgi:hypothetical protein